MTRILKARFEISAASRDVEQASAAVKELSDNIRKLARTAERNVQAQQNIREALRELEDQGVRSGAEFKQLHKDLDRLSTTMHETREQASDYAKTMHVLEDATEEHRKESLALTREMFEVTDAQRELNDETREAKRITDTYENALEDLTREQARLEYGLEDTVIALKAAENATLQTATKQKRLEQGTSTLVHELQAEENALQRVADKQARARHETQLWGVSMEDLKTSLITAVAAGGVAGLVFAGVELITDAFRKAKDAAVEFQRASIETFTSVEEEIARTKAQVPDLAQSQEQLYRSTTELARGLLKGPQETAEAMRKAQNLGSSYEDSLEQVAQATDAARVANAGMVDTLVAGLSTVNAYGRGVYDLGQVLDQYAFITQNSNLEMDDLITGMAKIISPAAEAGVSLEEVAAAMVVMARQGDDFQEIGDLLGLTLQQIAVRGTQLFDAFVQASGVGFREFAAGGGTLVEAMQLIQDEADETGQSIGELAIGSSKFYRDTQAGRGVQELSGRHIPELIEAYDEALTAQGALDSQTAEFTGTMYLLNEELDSAKQNAYAVEGSLTQGMARGFAQAKIDLYDFIAVQSDWLDQLLIMGDAGAKALDGINLAVVRNLAQEGIDFDVDDMAAGYREQRENLEIITMLMEGYNFESAEQLRLMYAIAKAQKEQDAEIAAAAEVRQGWFDDHQEYMAAVIPAGWSLVEAAEAETEAKEDAAEAEEEILSGVKIREEIEERIVARLEEQRALLDSAYSTSQNYVQTLSDLQTEFAITTDEESLEALQQQMKDAGDAVQTHYRQAIVDAMIANYGYSESVVDLAVEMGLITEEAGELQKEFVRIVSEGEKLAAMEGFKNLTLKEQAIAAERLADGLEASAQSAVDYFSEEQKYEGVTPGIARAEQGFEVPILAKPEDFDKLTDLESQLGGLTDEEYETTVTSNVQPALTELDILNTKIEDVVHDRYMTVYVSTSTGNGGGSQPPGPPEFGFAGGGNLTVPSGYNRDNFLIGVSSGEQVTVTPSEGTGASGKVVLNLEQNFSAGTHDTAAIAGASRDGLYAALEEAGLT